MTDLIFCSPRMKLLSFKLFLFLDFFHLLESIVDSPAFLAAATIDLMTFPAEALTIDPSIEAATKVERRRTLLLSTTVVDLQ